MVVVRVLVALAGVTIVAAVFGGAVRTVVTPRGIPSRLTRIVFLTLRWLFRLRARPGLPYEDRDRIMALYAPIGLLVLLVTWLALNFLGFGLVLWAVEGGSIASALQMSGSSLLTLGFARPSTGLGAVVAFFEAAGGLIMLALLIAYLPTIYSVFSRRENLVAGMEVRAGSPPSGVEVLQRAWRVDRFETLPSLWERAEQWFLEIRETHTSFPAVVFFRSPQPDHSWVIAGGAVLDAASLLLSAVDVPSEPQAAYCIRAGYLALRSVADFFRIPHDPNPKPDDPILIGRDEFDEACEALAAQGLPLKDDHDQAWRDFNGWRVNYDRVLIALAGLTMSPYAPWSSDRSIRDWRPRASLRELRRTHA
jgi:hypothetical protein